jgi:hypothetical protein
MSGGNLAHRLALVASPTSLSRALCAGLIEGAGRALKIVANATSYGIFVELIVVFHGRHERAVGLRWDDPLLFQMRLENVFLRFRPIVLSLARSTIFSAATLFSNNRNVQRARPLGGFEQAKGHCHVTK